MLDFGWADWVQGQVERVWDLMDISLLRSAIVDIDPAFKTWGPFLVRIGTNFLLTYLIAARFGTSPKTWTGRLDLEKSGSRLA